MVGRRGVSAYATPARSSSAWRRCTFSSDFFREKRQKTTKKMNSTAPQTMPMMIAMPSFSMPMRGWNSVAFGGAGVPSTGATVPLVPFRVEFGARVGRGSVRVGSRGSDGVSARVSVGGVGTLVLHSTCAHELFGPDPVGAQNVVAKPSTTNAPLQSTDAYWRMRARPLDGSQATTLKLPVDRAPCTLVAAREWHSSTS